MSHTTESPSSISLDSFDETQPSRSDWSDFLFNLDRDHFPDEAPELPDHLFFDPNEDDETWWAAQSAGGCNPDHGSPFDLELLTISARDWQFDDDAAIDAMYDERRDAFLGEVG
jgi:hypothetical protein